MQTNKQALFVQLNLKVFFFDGRKCGDYVFVCLTTCTRRNAIYAVL